MQVMLGAGRAAPPNRSTDRRVALASIAVAVGFLAAAAISLVLPPETRHGLWLPLHLALAGAATTAIAGVLPFFVAAFAAAQPASGRIRAGSLAAVAIGAGAISLGVTSGQSAVAVAGGIGFVIGIGLTGVAAIQPVRRALGPSRGLVVQAYLAALAFVGVGATIATLLIAGWPPVAGAWVQLKPAHAWLNLFGFASLVIATTLLHFYPTTVGARISAHWSGRLTIWATATGAALVAIGYADASDPLARAGAVLTIVGGVSLAINVADRWRHRARWTTDPGWHRFVIGGLSSAVAWYLLGIAIAGGRILALGSDPSGWSIELVGVPLVGGWVALSVVASASHLLPSVGPGDQAAHARQRAVLGRIGDVRLVAIDAGLVLLTMRALTGATGLDAVGAVLAALGFGSTFALLVRAIAVGARPARRAGG